MYAIETWDLSFSYKKTFILESIGLLVPTGRIYSYMGKNGAEESTDLLGLLSPSNGVVCPTNQELRTNRMQLLSYVTGLQFKILPTKR